MANKGTPLALALALVCVPDGSLDAPLGGIDVDSGSGGGGGLSIVGSDVRLGTSIIASDTVVSGSG